MIRIERPAAPGSLLASAVSALQRVENAVAAGQSPEFDRTVYAHRDVKAALIEAQHGKCCFCESKVRHVSPGDVEHLRPKAGFRQHPHSALEKPGYYWLAYAWDNLLFACEECNRREKRNLFPLEDPAKRARTADALAGERPVFVDPARDEPADHIEFREEVPVGRTKRGTATIESLGLRRPSLAERRLERIKILEQLRAAVVPLEAGGEAGLAEEIRHTLSDAIQAPAEFSAMAWSLLGPRDR